MRCKIKIIIFLDNSKESASSLEKTMDDYIISKKVVLNKHNAKNLN